MSVTTQIGSSNFNFLNADAFLITIMTKWQISTELVNEKSDFEKICPLTIMNHISTQIDF